MLVSRRNLRKALVAVGCLFGHVAAPAAGFGLVFIAAGGVLHGLSKAYLEQNRDLTTAGPYRFTRNPFYLANLSIDAGIALVIGELWIALVYFPIWALAYAATIRAEEERLRELFGARYEAYAARVPRFFPVRAPLEAAHARGRFDWANPSLMQGREYARLLGIALAPAAIAAAEQLRHHGVELFDPAQALELAAVLGVPALWILKLALAETFRRPERRLLPGIRAGGGRLAGGLAVSLPLLAVALATGQGVARIAAVALVLGSAFVSAVVLTRRTRVAAALLLGVLSIGLGVGFEEHWLSILPSLWFALAILDEIGQSRSQLRDARAESEAPDWSYRRPIAVAVACVAVLVGAVRYVVLPIT